jgi:hypothetical protein
VLVFDAAGDPDRLHAEIARGVDEALGRREPRHGA